MAFYWTPAAISDLSLLIFITLAIGYLLSRLRGLRQAGAQHGHTAWFVGALSGVALFTLLTLLEDTLYPSAGQLALPPQTVFLTAGLVCLLQFIYRFPSLPPALRREARIVLGLSLIYPLAELAYAIYRYVMLAEGIIRYRPGWTLIFLILAVGVVPFRKVALADRRPVSYWRKLSQPPDEAARLVRNLALLNLSPLLLMGISLLRDWGYLPNSTGAALTSAGMLFYLLMAVLFYAQALPEQTSFLVKLVAVTVALTLAFGGAAAHLLPPAFIQAYRNPNADLSGKTLRFSPNDRGGYTAAWAPYHLEPVGATPLPDYYSRAALDFEFPFFDAAWSELTVASRAYVTFGRLVDLRDTLFQYGSTPAIYVLGLDLAPPPDGDGMGVFFDSTPQQATITWLDLPEYANPDHRNSIQLTLYPDGAFDITFIQLDPAGPFDVADPWRSYRFIGALPGQGSPAPGYFQVSRDLPYAGGANGAGQDYHREFRRALHQLLQPLATLMLVVAGLIALAIPLYFRRTLVRPLDSLLAGMARVDVGDLDVALPIQYNDEFGALTASFNRTVEMLRALVYNLEEAVAERTDALSRSQQQTAAAHARLEIILNNLDVLVYVTDVETDEILFANAQTQAVFGAVVGQTCWRVLQAGQSGPCAFCSKPQLLDGGAPAGVHHWEVDNTRNGRTYAIADSIIEWLDGHFVHLLMATDVTPLKTAQALLVDRQRALAALEERERIGRDLHDSLGQVIAFLNLQMQAVRALWRDDQRAAAEKLLAQLVEVSQQAHNQVREFILGMKKPERLDADFWTALHTCAQTFEAEQQIPVLLSLPPNAGPWLVPPHDLGLLRIIQEALANVRKHADAHQVQIIASRTAPDRAQFIVSDDGQGFDPAAPLPDADRHFGLTIMRDRARELGGSLEIRSVPGQGTQILVNVPIEPPEPPPPPPSALPLNAAPLRILLVDDHPTLRDGLRHLLTSYGLEVVGLANNGLEAQTLARQTRPDLILMDVHMPVCDGIEATRRIKAEFPEQRIVMLTVSAEDEILFAALQAGASGYLLKSMQIEELFTLITDLDDRGAPPIAPQLAGRIVAEFQQMVRPEVTLSPEQWQILRCLAEGLTYQEIASQVHLSERSVKRKMRQIMELLQLNSRAEVEAYARRRLPEIAPDPDDKK